MGDPEDRRHLLDPRYVTWEAFDRRTHDVDSRFQRNERQAELHESDVNRQLAETQQELVRLRVSQARQAVYLSLVQALVVAAATGWITFQIGHH